MAVAREIKFYNPNFVNNKKAIKSAFAALKENGFIVLKGEDNCFLILSFDKSIEQIDTAIYSLLAVEYIRLRRENIFKEFERV